MDANKKFESRLKRCCTSINKILEFESRLKRCCTSINKILEDAKEIYPDATLYLDGSGTLCLMSSDSHDRNGIALQENIIARGYLVAGGGDR